ncbi:PREDICTED: GATA transcription factor 12-like [Camelina sativa]|uniref:GATA transcription factor n=1 Tax=Camelina sativa TaxID=90675 RepID=A0ABM0VEF5_CAMSA|nr:PREDICTED: GATA transcription factor 12-like [Camelina sativa]
MEDEAHDFFHAADHFAVDDLLVDFSNDDDEENDVVADSTTTTTTAFTDSSNISAIDLPNFSGDVQDGTSFSGDLCVPCDDLADELAWLSNIVDESFSPEDVQKLQLISGFNTRPSPKSESGCSENPNSTSPIFTTDVSVPAKARSKRSRAAACNWASRGLLMETVYDNPFTGETILSSHNLSPPTSPPPPMAHLAKKQATDGGYRRKKDVSSPESGGAEERRCLHCATDKTPQWRTGPMGPKTLCNACGVRYKSGRLVPEYRPAASPTFVLTKHSNSHRKVMELRRQKEMSKGHHEFIHHHHGTDSAMIFDVSSEGDDYLINHKVGPDFRQLI